MISSIYFLFLGTFGWGISLYLIKILLVSLTPIEIVLYRMAIGSITLLFIMRILKIPLINMRQVCLDGTVLGVFNIAIPYYLTTVAEKHVSSSLVAILNALTPLFTFLLGVCIFSMKKQFNYMSVISICFGLLGTFIIHMDFTLTQANLFSFFAIMIACLSYAIAANYVSMYANTKHPVLVSTIAAVVSTICLLGYKLTSHEALHWSMPHSSAEIISLCWLGIVGSGVSLYLYCLLIKQTNATTASMVTYLMTATSVMSGVMFLKESFSLYSMIGCFFIMMSLLLIDRSRISSKR